MIGGGADSALLVARPLCLRVALRRVYNSLIENMRDEQMFRGELFLTGARNVLAGAPTRLASRTRSRQSCAPLRAISEQRGSHLRSAFVLRIGPLID